VLFQRHIEITIQSSAKWCKTGSWKIQDQGTTAQTDNTTRTILEGKKRKGSNWGWVQKLIQ